LPSSASSHHQRSPDHRPRHFSEGSVAIIAADQKRGACISRPAFIVLRRRSATAALGGYKKLTAFAAPR
jgi:hypothetical protein